MSRRKKNDKGMNNFFRFYWREPGLASQLSEEQREKVTERFLELLEKNREEETERMSKIMKERNRLLPFVTKEMREK